MKKLILSLLMSVLAYGFDELLIEAQSSVLPKIALLDKEIQKKLVGGKLHIIVAHEPADAEYAKEIAQKITQNSGGKAGGVAVVVTAVEFSQLPKTSASAVYILGSTSDANVKKAAGVAMQKKIVSFSYDKTDLKNGVMLSMWIERTAVIALSRSVMKDSGIQFVDAFYKIARIVE